MKRSRRWATIVTLGLCCVLSPARLKAAIPADCAELGIAITEHSCFHSEFGPFTTVMATAGSDVSAGTPDVSQVHTEYRIGLTGEYSVVTYTARRAGAWAVLLGQDVPLQVLARKAEALPSILDQSGATGCDALPLLHVYELTAATEYRLVFGPTAHRTVVAVIEYIDDFLTQNGRDDDGDGFGSDVEVVVTPCKPPAGFAPNTRDCDDADPSINPSSEEICDGVDQNCNGVADDVGLVCRVGTGSCRTEGKIACAASGSETTCTATPSTGNPEVCNGQDDDCNGKIDDAADLCPDPDRPTCVRSGMSASCGCQLDLDCGGLASGRVCSTQSGACESGCSPLPGRNGCADGESCDEATGRCEPPASAGGAGGGANELGPGGVGGHEPGAPEPGGWEGGEPGSSPGGNGHRTVTSGGCGCRTMGGAESRGSALAIFAALLASTVLRRRRRSSARWLSVVLAASSALACGGRVQDSFASAGGGASFPDEPAGGKSAGGSAVDTSGAGGTGGALAGCERTLGEEPIGHACSHVTNGPFVPVVAGASIAPPDVSDLHHTYEVQVVGPGARLRYRAQRQGNHAFMTDSSVTFAMSRAGRTLSASPSFGVQGCRHLTRATVYDLKPEAEYELALLESAPELELFVEHLGAFGSGAWEEPCSEGTER